MSYAVSLDVYHGPLELLLQLVERKDLDICDVSLVQITADYLNAIAGKDLPSQDLQSFLAVAAQLISIKAHTLAGSVRQNEPDEESELTTKLRDYQSVRSQTKQLHKLYKLAQPSFASAHSPMIGDYRHLVAKLAQSAHKQSNLQATREQFQLRFARNRPELMQYRQSFALLITKQNNLGVSELLADCANADQAIVYFLCILESIHSGAVAPKIHNNQLYLAPATS